MFTLESFVNKFVLHLFRKNVKLEEEMELMDIKAEVLYRKLVDVIGGDDHSEVDHIIKLVALNKEKT